MMDNAVNGNLSIRTFHIHDHLGYSPEMVHNRRLLYWERDLKGNSVNDEYIATTAGSKGEGFSSPTESDIDVLYTFKHILCMNNAGVSDDKNDTIFQMENEKCHPGHFELKFHQQSNDDTKNIPNLHKAMVKQEKDSTYISSELFRKLISESTNKVMHQDFSAENLAGPAIPHSKGLVRLERVFAFRCPHPQAILTNWIKRVRPYNWPPAWLIEEVAKQEAQLVPVGCKGSKNNAMEWRICFIPGELLLTKSLNETQYKLYIVLKQVNKSQLKPICQEMSSYIMKNIVYWIVETNPRDIFYPENILLLLVSCLTMLLQSVKENCLRYYMIPDRNLLKDRITDEEQVKLINKIQELIAEGPALVLRVERLKTALETAEDELVAKGHRKDRLEILDLVRGNIEAKHCRPDLSHKEEHALVRGDPEYKSVLERMCDLVLTEWRQCPEEDREEILHRKVEQALACN
ncbi:uncharacterized protein LOC128231267 [Mya arenaria]|uniref:uncharacterized protein LOC128231267 n=1 Tax=Mya arenaria TaxID=6604 RepID=UPI0022DF06FB|nr:uncharacterized protein LOC128231267 [Mya arenaria]